MSHVQVDRPWAAAQQALKGSATFIVGRANSVALAPEVDDTVERNPKRRHGGLARLVAPQVSLVKGQSALGLPGVAACASMGVLPTSLLASGMAPMLIMSLITIPHTCLVRTALQAVASTSNSSARRSKGRSAAGGSRCRRNWFCGTQAGGPGGSVYQ